LQWRLRQRKLASKLNLKTAEEQTRTEVEAARDLPTTNLKRRQQNDDGGGKLELWVLKVETRNGGAETAILLNKDSHNGDATVGV
jgi:aspartate-semialdehyde dehydrogenase